MRRGLLLGAGFSYDLGMPLVVEVSEVFLNLFNKRNSRRLGDKLATRDPYGEGRPVDEAGIREGLDLVLSYKRDGGKNYEELLGRLERLPSRNQSTRDSHHYLFSIFYDLLYDILTTYQAISYVLAYEKNWRWFGRLDNLLSDHGETWVFTPCPDPLRVT